MMLFVRSVSCQDPSCLVADDPRSLTVYLLSFFAWQAGRMAKAKAGAARWETEKALLLPVSAL